MSVVKSSGCFACKHITCAHVEAVSAHSTRSIHCICIVYYIYHSHSFSFPMMCTVHYTLYSNSYTHTVILAKQFTMEEMYAAIASVVVLVVVTVYACISIDKRNSNSHTYNNDESVRNSIHV